jgi:tRNA-dihydrouridine synthase B
MATMTLLGRSEFSLDLQQKINSAKEKATPVKVGSLTFSSPLFMAPLSGITHASYRVLMEKLGAGNTTTELISSHGINHGNKQTRRMLEIHPEEKNMGIQLFGEDAGAMAQASLVAMEYRPQFIDINMGCPVRKVVDKGAGSALLKDPQKLAPYLRKIKKNLTIPLSIKIRTGWDSESVTAREIINVANDEGVEFVSVHGRTRAQQYSGKNNWELLERLATDSKLPIIGNGDLHSPNLVREKLGNTNCQALMLGRGPLVHPFIFLESLPGNEGLTFTPKDYLEVINHFCYLLQQAHEDNQKFVLIQMKKHIVWMVRGFHKAASFRQDIFSSHSLEEVFQKTEDFFGNLPSMERKGSLDSFMCGGHG